LIFVSKNLHNFFMDGYMPSSNLIDFIKTNVELGKNENDFENMEVSYALN